MANVLIKELDSTAYLNRSINNDNLVYVAGSHAQGKASKGEPIVVRSLKEFYENFGSAPYSGDKTGWEYAANIIRAGFPVIYYSYYKMSGSGSDFPEGSKMTLAFPEEVLSYLGDKIRCRVKFIPTIYDFDLTTYNKLLNVISDESDNGGRGDALILVDFANGVTDPNNDNYTPKLAEEVVGTSYAIVASPSAFYNSPITGDSNLEMPPSFWMLKTMAEGVASGLPIWSIWAGVKRGLIKGVEKFTSKVSMQTMRNWTESESVIPLMNIPSYGDVIYGNNTRLHSYEVDTPTQVRSALDSLNVRLVANEIKRAIYDICLGLTFDSNDLILWNEFKERLIPILDGMKSGRGLNEYLIIMDETVVTDQNIDALTVPGIVKVDISRAAEKFDIVFELTPTGAVFDNI